MRTQFHHSTSLGEEHTHTQTLKTRSPPSHAPPPLATPSAAPPLPQLALPSDTIQGVRAPRAPPAPLHRSSAPLLCTTTPLYHSMLFHRSSSFHPLKAAECGRARGRVGPRARVPSAAGVAALLLLLLLLLHDVCVRRDECLYLLPERRVRHQRL